jgi:hypothetical protein
MSFRLRFLLVLLQSLWRRESIDPRRPFRNTYRVWITEAELSVVENARYAYLFVLERFRLLFCTPLLGACWKNGWTTVMGAQIYKVKRPLKRFQKFEIITEPLCYDEKWIYFQQRIESGGKLYCTGVISVIFLAPDRKIPTREVFEKAGLAFDSPPFPESVRKFVDAEATLQ